MLKLLGSRSTSSPKTNRLASNVDSGNYRAVGVNRKTSRFICGIFQRFRADAVLPLEVPNVASLDDDKRPIGRDGYASIAIVGFSNTAELLQCSTAQRSWPNSWNELADRNSSPRMLAGFRSCGLLVVTFLGCGTKSEPHRVAVRGSVIVGDKLVPEGIVGFLPETGNAGPVAMTRVVGGLYNFTK